MPPTLTHAILDRLLAEFAALPRSGPRDRTLLQIAGYPQLEEVASNILAFYLDPSSAHGFGTLLLDTLLTFLPEIGPVSAQSVRVEREVVTTGGKRIDIVVATDTLVLGIENKINHAVINPFDEYVAHMQLISEGRPVHGVLLSYRPVAPFPSHAGFVPVSYARYFGRVLEQLEPVTLPVREPYLTFLRDFIRTMQDPNEERMLDASIVDYLQKRRSEVEALVKATNTFHRAATQKLKSLAAALTPYLDEQTVFSGMSSGYPDLFDVLSYRVLVSESVAVQININISPDGWYFNLRNHKGDQVSNRIALQDWLTSCGVNWFVRYERPWRLGCSHDEPLPYTSDPGMIQERLVELLRQVRGPLGDSI